MRFSPYDMHVEGLTASRRTEAEKIGVIRYLVLSLLSADVDGNRHTLAVCIVNLQWGFLTMLNALFVHETGGCITESQEAVILWVGGVAITRE